MASTSPRPSSASAIARAQANVKAVQAWLRNQGFTVDYTPSNRLYVAAEGTVAQAAAAFKVSFGNYRVNGMTLRSPKSAFSIPGSLAGKVQAIAGLDESAALVRPTTKPAAPPPDVFVNGTAVLDVLGSGRHEHRHQRRDLAAQHLWQPDAICTVRLHAAAGSRRLRRAELADRRRRHRSRSSTPTRRRRSSTTSRPGRQPAGSPAFKPGQFSQIVAPGTYRRPQNNRQDPQGWSGRGDPRHRGRPRHGPRRQDRLRRRPEQLPGPRRGHEPRRRSAPGRHRDQLATAGPARRCRRASSSRSTTSSSRPRPRASASTSRPATAATRPAAIRPMRPPRPPTARPRTRGSPPSAGPSIGIDQSNAIALETGWESGTSTYHSDTNVLDARPSR